MVKNLPLTMILAVPRAVRVTGRGTCSGSCDLAGRATALGSLPQHPHQVLLSELQQLHKGWGTEACAGFSITASPICCVNKHRKENPSVREDAFTGVQVRGQCRARTGNTTTTEKQGIFLTQLIPFLMGNVILGWN